MAGSEIKVLDTMPVVTKLGTTGSTKSEGRTIIAAYKVKADGDADVKLGKTVFKLNSEGIGLSDLKLEVYEKSNYQDTPVNVAIGTGNALKFDIKYVNANSDRVVSDTKIIDADMSSIEVRSNHTSYIVLSAGTKTGTGTLTTRIEDAAYAANTRGMSFTTPAIQGNLLLEKDIFIERF